MRVRTLACALASAGLLAALARPAAAAPGSLDPSFGTNGIVRTDLTPKGDTAYAVAVQPDGRIVAAGSAANSATFAVVRYLRDGALDPSFGNGGVVRTDFGPYQDAAYAVAIQSDGDIVAAGVEGANRPNSSIALARYLPDGTPDPAFGTGGKVTTPVSPKDDEADGVRIESGGDIVVAGGAGLNGTNPDFVVLRYTPDGVLDPSFGTKGIVRTDFGGDSFDWAIGGLVVQPNGDIVAGGYSIRVSSPSDGRFALARYLPGGNLDPSFGNDGLVTTNFTTHTDYISGLALDGSDIVAVGEAGTRSSRDTAALARYTPAGKLDPTFGTGGTVTTDYGPFGDAAAAVAIDPSTQDLVTAGAIGLGGPNPKFAVCRYTPAGKLDPTFGKGGEVFSDLGPSDDHANAVAIQPSGRIIAAGVARSGSGNSKFALAGYES